MMRRLPAAHLTAYVPRHLGEALVAGRGDDDAVARREQRPHRQVDALLRRADVDLLRPDGLVLARDLVAQEERALVVLDVAERERLLPPQRVVVRQRQQRAHLQRLALGRREQHTQSLSVVRRSCQQDQS